MQFIILQTYNIQMSAVREFEHLNNLSGTALDNGFNYVGAKGTFVGIKAYQVLDKSVAVSVTLAHDSKFGEARLSVLRTTLIGGLRLPTDGLNLGLALDESGGLVGFTGRPSPESGIFVAQRMIYKADIADDPDLRPGVHNVAYKLDPSGQEAWAEAGAFEKPNIKRDSKKKEDRPDIVAVDTGYLRQLGLPEAPDLYATVLQWVSREVRDPNGDYRQLSPEELAMRPVLLAKKEIE